MIVWNLGCLLEDEIWALVWVRFACPHPVALAVDNDALGKNAFAYCIDFSYSIHYALCPSVQPFSAAGQRSANAYGKRAHVV